MERENVSSPHQVHCDGEFVSVEQAVTVDVREIPDLAQDGHGQLGAHHHLADLCESVI